MDRDDDDAPHDSAALEGTSLLEAMTVAGAAVDQAQVVGDVAAHRVVQVVAECADGNPPAITDVIGPPAVQSQRIAADIADAAARYEQTRAEQCSQIENLDEAPEPDALKDLQEVTADSKRAEAEATLLLDHIDGAQHRLQRRAATTLPTRTDAGRRPAADGPDAASPATYLH